MKIQCPNCKKITELEHIDHGSQVECVCSTVFTVDESTVTEEYTEVDSRLPERIGQYEVTGLIGFGGMGKVYLAKHPNLGIPVAIKSLRVEYMTDEASCERFVQSAKICAKINHPNIVRIYDCGYEDGKVYLVMEYITKGSALTLLEQEGKLDPEYAAFIMLEVCSGLMEAEKYGIVHRDIKPENIMFDSEGTVKILDLGLSKIIGDQRISKQSITTSLTALGTPLYMAPEQAVDAANCDSRADIYSMGVTLYQFCTGKLPFDSEDPHELRRMHALEKPVPPRELVPELRPDMETIILRCLEKRREDRYATIADLALDLEAYLKNRVLPSTIPQHPNLPAPEAAVTGTGDKGRFLRLLFFSWKSFWRRGAASARFRLLTAGVTAIVLSSAIIPIVLWQGRAVPPKKAPGAPLTEVKIFADLSRQAANYLKVLDYGPAIALYRNYHGELETETREMRERIARGYEVTKKQQEENLLFEISELLLKREYARALELYRKQNGKQLCPGADSLPKEFLQIPSLFQVYWKDRQGKTMDLIMEKHGRIPLRIIDADQNAVYADRLDTGEKLHFSLSDLGLEEQLKIIGQNPVLRHFWSGACYLKQGLEAEAEAEFRQVPVYGRVLTKLVRLGPAAPRSGTGSGRSR